MLVPYTKNQVKKKGILYCAMQIYDKGAFLVAIDQKNNMGFVQKLLGWRYAATFYKDDYYVSGEQGLSIVKNVPSLKKYKSWVELNSAFYGHGTQAGETKVALYMGDENSKNFGLGADFVIWKKNSEKAGTPANDYLMTLKDKELLLIQLSKGGEDVSSNEVISLASNVHVGPNGKRCWGAAWNFNGAIFFSADDGYGGLWRFDTADFEAKTATFTNMTAVNKIDWNDGFTCGDSLKIKKDPQPCEHDFYQVVTSMYVDPATDKTVDANGNPTPWSDSPQTKTTSRTYVRHLDKKSGTFTNDFTVDRSKFPSMTSLNACAVHPKSNKLYCMMNTLSYQSIAVVDETGPALVMKHEPAAGGSSLCFAAVFDSKENYWYWCNDKYLYRAQKLDSKKILWSENDNDWSSNDEKAFGPEFTDDKVGADFVVWEEGKKIYLISIVESTDNKVSVIDVTTGKPGKPEIFASSGLESTIKNGQKVTWGSSWTAPVGGENAGKAFFTPDAKPQSANSEKVDSLFQLEKLDFEAKKAYFVGGGMAAPAQWHDGFTCKTKIASAGKGRQEIDSR